MSSTRPGQSSFRRLDVETLHVNYLAVDELPIRSRGQPVGLSLFPNDLGFITASSLVQADLSVTDPTSRAFVRGQRPLSAVAYSGLASDLIGSVQSSVLQADWLQGDTTLASFVRNKPQLAAVATQGRYDSLLPGTGQPPQVLAADASITGVQGASIPVVNLPVPPRQIAPDWASTDQNSLATIRNRPTLAAVAVSGAWADVLQRPTVYDSVDYSLLQNSGTTLAIRNLPSIPAPQQNSDWLASTGVTAILNRPTTAQLQSQLLVQSSWTETNSSSYAYISGKPVIPAAQVQTDWSATSGIASIANKPALGKVATSNLYGDLQGLPTIPAAQTATDWQVSDGSKPNALINRPTWSTLAYTGRYSDILPNTGQPAIPNSVDWNATSSTTTTLSIINRPQFTTPVQANYQETDSSQLSYIRGKPTLATVAATGSYTDLVNVPPNAAAQQQADYGQTDSTSVAFIKGKPTLAAVASSGRYDALVAGSGQPPSYLYADWNATSSGNGALVIYNKPAIPPAQIQSDFGVTDSTQPSYIKNLPAFAKVATTGSYTDLSNTPTIAPQIQADLAQTDSTKLDFVKGQVALAAVATSGRYDSLLAGTGQPTVPTSVSWLATASTATVLYIPDKPTKLSAFTNDSGFYSSGSDISCGLLSSSGAARLNAGVTTTTITFSGGVTGFSGAYSQLSGLPTSLSQFVNNLTGSAGNWTVNNSGTLFTDNLGPATQGGGVFLQMGLTVPFELFGAIQSETQADGSTASVDAGYIALNYFDTGRDSTKPGVALRLVDLSSRPRLGVRARAAGSSTATTDGDLDVGTLTASRNLAVAGTGTFAGTLTAGAVAAGAVTAASLAASGAISSGGTISGAVSATSLAASGATTLNSTLGVSGATTAAAVSCTTLAASGGVSGPIAATTLSASGAATLNSTLAVTGATTAAGISCSGLSCAGTVSGAVQATTLNASGAASLGAALSVATSLTVAGNTVYLGNNRAGLYRTGGANPITVLQANDVITPDTTLAGGAFLVDSANNQFSWQSRPANSSTDTTVATLSFTTGNFSTTGTLAASGGVAGPVAATTLSASGATTAAAVSCTSLTASGTVSGAVQASTLSASGAATLSSTLSVAGATTAAALTTSGLATLSRVQVGDTSDSTLGLSIMSSTMAAGSLRGLCVGQAASNFNRAELFFFYQGSGLAANRARFGLYGVDGVSVWGNGFVGVNAGTTQPTAQLSVTGTLAASGSAALTGIVNAGTISSTGAVSAPILASTLSASGATTLNSTLSISGSTSAAAVSCSSLSSSGNISGPVAATVLSASGAATLSGSLGVSGATTTAGISCTTLTSTGTIAGPVAATTLSASGAATLSGTLAVSGATTAAAISCTTLSASGATTLSSALAVSGTTTAAAISCTALNSSGNVSAPIAATTLSASGAATLSNTLAVSGATTLNGTLAGTGATFSGTLATNQLVATTPGGSSSVGRAVQTNLDVGDLVSWRGTQAGDAYGFGQYTGGATRLFASSYYSPASVSLSFATNTTANYSGGFTDVLRVTQGSPNAVTIAGSLSASGSTSLGGSLAVTAAITCSSLSSSATISGPIAATTLSASGAATFNSSVAVTGTTSTAAISCSSLTSSGAIGGPVSASSLSASGATTLNGTLAGTGATFSGTLAANQLVATTPGGSSSVGRAVQTNLDVGDLVSWRGTQAGDAYGFGQYTGGATRLFASSYYSPASVSLSFATNTTANYTGGFTDVLRVTQGSPNAVTIAGSLSASGSTSIGGSLAVAGATSLTGNVSLISGSSPALAVINSAGNGASAYINMGGYNTFSNGSPLTLQCLDSNYSADLVVLTKTAGAAGNAQAERFRIGNSGAVSMAGQISSGYHYITGADANSRSILSLAAPNPINTIAWGQALATNQSAFLNYVSATSSKIQMGIYGSNPVTVDAGGNMAVPALLTTSNRFSVHLYPITTFSLPANTASVYPAASWSNYSSQGAQPQYTNNSTPYTSNTNGMLDSNGYWLCPASGVWAVSFGVVYSSSGTTTTNACWLIVTSGTTDVSQNGLLGNVNQRLGLQQNSGLFGTAAVTQCFAAGDRVAPVMMSNTAQTVGGNTQGLLNISLVTLLT